MVTIILDEETIFEVGCRNTAAEADQLLESLDMLPPPSGERRFG